MKELWQVELDKVNQVPQAQDSTVEQLHKLRVIANKFGLYDAADYLRNRLEESK